MADVALLHGDGTLYGASRVLVQDVANLHAAGVSTAVYLAMDGPLKTKLEEQGSEVHVVPLRVLRRVRRLGNIRLPTSLPFRSREHSLVILWTLSLAAYGPLLRARKRPHAVSVHELMPGTLGGSTLLRLAASRRTPVQANSHEIARWIGHAIGGRRILMAYPQAPPYRLAWDRVGANEADRLRCFLVGRVNGKKGHLEAITAVNRLRALGVNAELTLAGAPFPGQERHLEALQRAVGHQSWARYVGEVDGLETLCATHDVCLCLPRFLEPFGFVALETWSHGTRTVGLDVGGAQEALRLVDGVVVDDPSPAGIAQCLAAVAHSSRLRGPPAKTAPASRLCTPRARQAVWRNVLEQCA